MNNQQTIDFNVLKFEIQVRFYPAPNEFKEALIDSFGDYFQLKKSEETINFDINKLTESGAFGYGSILFEGNEEQLNKLLDVLHSNEQYVKVRGVEDLNKTIAEVYQSDSGPLIRENRFFPSEEFSSLEIEEITELLSLEDFERFKKNDRVLFWIDQRKLKHIIQKNEGVQIV